MWFQTDKPGLYLGQCAEYCGTQHANMLIRVVVDSPSDFEAWLANERKPAVERPRRAGRAVRLPRPVVRQLSSGARHSRAGAATRRT